MKKILLMVAAAMMAVVSVEAQKIQAVDKDGQPVPFASVISEDGNIIGTTGLDGILDDVKGAEVVSITHVAYKPKKVKVEQGGRVTLEDADFDLPEVTVTKKPLVYVQTYYRIISLSVESDSDKTICYYRAGVLNNSYDRKTKNTTCDEEHYSACNIGAVKTALNLVIGSYAKQIGGLKMGKMEDRMKKKWKDIGLTFTPDGSGKLLITDKFGKIGSVTDNHAKGERRYSYETHLISRHQLQMTGTDKQKAKAAKKDEYKKNRVDQDFVVYRIDEEGNYLPEDFVMQQSYRSYDNTKNDSNSHEIMLIQLFTTDRAYVTKDELKQIKKDNKMKMTYQNILNFERDHRIPDVPADLKKRINEIAK